MYEDLEPKECPAFRIARRNLRTRGRKRMPRGYRKDPKEYRIVTIDENNNEKR